MEKLIEISKEVNRVYDELDSNKPDDYTLKSTLVIMFEAFALAYADCTGVSEEKCWEFLNNQFPMKEGKDEQ